MDWGNLSGAGVAMTGAVGVIVAAIIGAISTWLSTWLSHRRTRQGQIMQVITEEATVLELLPEDHPSRDALMAHIEERVSVYLKRRIQTSDVDDDLAAGPAPLSTIKRFFLNTFAWLLMLAGGMCLIAIAFWGRVEYQLMPLQLSVMVVVYSFPIALGGNILGGTAKRPRAQRPGPPAHLRKEDRQQSNGDRDGKQAQSLGSPLLGRVPEAHVLASQPGAAGRVIERPEPVKGSNGEFDEGQDDEGRA